MPSPGMDNIGTKVSDIVNKVILELSQVPGAATQTYSAARITQYVEDTYLTVIEKKWWPELMHYFQTSLDGTTGHITTDLVGVQLNSDYVKNYRDIAAVWPSDSNRKLRQVPPGMNPFTLSGSQPLYVQAETDHTLTARPIQVFPITATGDLVIWARQRNNIPISSGDYIYLDALLMIYGAAWMYATDDGTVPGAVDKFQGLFQDRLDTLMAADNNQPLQLDPRISITTDQWWEVP